MKLDAYTLKARIAPAAITALIPILVFNHFYVSEEFQKLVGYILGLKLLSALTISAISIFFLAEACRFASKELFQRLFFQDELRMPTTQFMLFSDTTYSEDYKRRFRAKVLQDFGITLPTADEELSSENDARKRIAEAMASIRKKLHTNPFLLQHNIEYGAIRNSLGGAVVAVPLALLDIGFFSGLVKNVFAVHVSIVLVVVFALWVCLSPWLIKSYGCSYARVLFREYLD